MPFPILPKFAQPGPTERDEIRLALRLAEREIGGSREWPDETTCSNAGTQAYKCARAICEGVRQAMRENEHPGEQGA